MTTINVKLLRKIQRHILEEPKRLDMECFIDRKADYVTVHEFPKCGTVGCIAAWAVTCSTKEKVPYSKIADRARKLLGITYLQADRLFYASRWPERFKRIDNTNPQTRLHAVITAKRIEHFIKTKGAE
jgi:hypothetical protein